MRLGTVLLWLFASVGTFSAAVATAAAEAGAGDGSDESAVRPVKISKSDQAGKIFEGTGVNRSERDGNVTLDVTTQAALGTIRAQLRAFHDHAMK